MEFTKSLKWSNFMVMVERVSSKLLLKLVIVAVSVVPMWGQSVFRDGMVWNTEVGQLFRHGGEFVYILDGDTLVGKDKGLKLFCIKNGDTENRHLVAIIRSDRDKVFFLSGHDPNKWTLMYDFSLTPGKGCWVGTISSFGASDVSPKLSYVRCKEIVKDGESGEYEVMMMEEPYEGRDCVGVWIKGVGGIQGILSNNGFCLDGRNSMLKEVSCGDRILYMDR